MVSTDKSSIWSQLHVTGLEGTLLHHTVTKYEYGTLKTLERQLDRLSIRIIVYSRT
jgi:hypothetical protein